MQNSKVERTPESFENGKISQIFARPLCAYTEEASGHSSYPLEAGEAPFLPVVPGIAQQLLLKLMAEIRNSFFPTKKSVHSSHCRTNLLTFLVGSIDTFSHLFFAVGVHVHVRKDPGLVGPQIVIGAEEVDRKLSNVVSHPLDIIWDGFGMADLCWPPPLQNRREKKTPHLT